MIDFGVRGDAGEAQRQTNGLGLIGAWLHEKAGHVISAKERVIQLRVRNLITPSKA
jgi:hypothetical protein